MSSCLHLRTKYARNVILSGRLLYSESGKQSLFLFSIERARIFLTRNYLKESRLPDRNKK